MSAEALVLPRFRWDAVAAIYQREWWVFRRVWLAPTFGSLVEPIIYLVAFGYGFGALVATAGGLPYLDFIATGAAAITTVFTGAFPGLVNGFNRRRTNHLYEGLLGAPLSIPELVTGEASWTATRTAASSTITILVAMALGVRIGWGLLLVPAIGALSGFGFHLLGACCASKLRSNHQFSFVTAGIIVPLFVVAGTYFPLDGIPTWLATLAWANPLTHVTRLFRFVAFGGSVAGALGSLAVVVAFAGLAWVVAVRWLRDALVP